MSTRASAPRRWAGARSSCCSIDDDPQAVIERAVGLGATQVYAAEAQHGWLLGHIEDPFGHHWEIGRPLIDWPPSQGHSAGG